MDLLVIVDINAGEKEEDIYEDLCSFNSRSKQLQNEIHSLQPVEKRDYILKVDTVTQFQW
jgi:hypothetical protein